MATEAIQMVFRKIEKEKSGFPKRICFDSKMEELTKDTSVVQLFGLPIVKTEPNNNQAETLERGTIYVISDFEKSPILNQKHLSLSDVWIFGPTLLEEITELSKITWRNKPMYCMSMYGLCFFINCPGNIPLMERMVQLIKWMGGVFAPEPNRYITHMISNSARANGYSYCWTFNVPILTPEWVEYCWQHRDEVGFRADLHMENFKLKTFEDLHLSFMGFEPSDSEKLESLTKENGGTVVSWFSPACTHVVFSYEYSHDEIIAAIPSNVFLVNPDWFHISVQNKNRIPEDDFKKCVQTSRFSESRANMDFDVSQCESDEESEDQPPQSSIHQDLQVSSVSSSDTREETSSLARKRDAKRKLNFEELHQTERNYIACLQKLVDLKNEALDESKTGVPVLNKTQAKLIFGNLEEICNIHKLIERKMNDNLTNWGNDITSSMREIINAKTELIKEYVDYTKHVEDYQTACKKFENENVGFKNLIRSKMCDTKQSVKDLFVRPIQRLCSVQLLLNELKKNTAEKSRDEDVLIESINVIQTTVTMMDKKKQMSNKIRAIFDVVYKTENCPHDLLTSHREYIVEFSAKEVIEITDFSKILGELIRFFLFNDVLMAAKVRKSQSPKPYKHIVTLSLCMIKKILTFEDEGENKSGVFGFIIRDLLDEHKTTTCCFVYSEEVNGPECDDVLLKIATQISSRSCNMSAEDCILRRVPAGRFSFQPINNSAKSKKPLGSEIFKLITKKLLPKPAAKPHQKDENSKLKRKSVSCSELSIF